MQALKRADMTDEADEGARAVCSPGEAEDVDLVSGIVVEDEEALGLADVVDQAGAEHAAPELVQIAGADTLVIVDDLRDAVAPIRSMLAAVSTTFVARPGSSLFQVPSKQKTSGSSSFPRTDLHRDLMARIRPAVFKPI
ncbi:hypothetical protein [Sphingomonas sp. BK580]|uniref:hypothetical protein n=1 Tax=Sphingomonas sp. BK580 TaxID=2586972 RepID=UPI00184ED6CF|nr:hypothetical protein [Sphingomonas sp. BK580]MBB3693529.1 hypothetical protein [Sphingomonas sp. BK580]